MPAPSAIDAAASAFNTLWRPGIDRPTSTSPIGVTSVKCALARQQVDRVRGDVGGGVEPETNEAAAVRAFGEIRRERIVGIDHRDAVGGQRVVDRALGVGDAEQAAHAFQVRGRDVVDER